MEKHNKIRAARLPIQAQEVFQSSGIKGERVRTMLVGVNFEDDAFRPFAQFASDAQGTKERLDWLLEEWTAAMQYVLDRIREDLWEKRPDILLLAAAKPDYKDALEARRQGFLKEYTDGNRREVQINLGSRERPLHTKVLWYGKPGKESYCAPAEEIRVKYCAEVSLNTFVEIEKNGEEFCFNKFSAMELGKFLSAAYFSSKVQEKDHSSGPIPEEYIRANKNRVHDKYLIAAKFVCKTDEPMRQKIAETVCSFLEKYLSVQPEVRKLLGAHEDMMRQAKKFFDEHASRLSPNAVMAWSEVEEEIKKRPACNPESPSDVLEYGAWVHAYNEAVNRFQNELSSELKEGGDEKQYGVKFLEEVKGYPSFPAYKKNSEHEFKACIKSLEELGNEGGEKPSFAGLVKWVKSTWAENECRRRNYFIDRGLSEKHSGARPLPLLKRIAREMFQRTEGKIEKNKEGSYEVTWNPAQEKILTIAAEHEKKMERQITRMKMHCDKVQEDAAARRLLVDLLVAKVRLKNLGEEEQKNIREANMLAGQAKGSLLQLVEGDKRECQISGLTLKENGAGFSLAKNACFLLSTGEKQKLALVMDYSKQIRGSGLKIHAKKSSENGVRAFGFLGEGEARKIVVGNPEGKLGDYGVVLPLAFGSSQARRYLYPKNGHPENGMLDAIACGVDIKNARIIREQGPDRTTKYFVALSVGIPSRVVDVVSREPEGFIGVDRGESSLAVFAYTDSSGVLMEAPELHGKNMVRDVRRSYRRVKSMQSQAKRLTGGEWFKRKIDNEVRIIAIKAVHKMLRYRSGIVLENLSRGFSRGSTASWEHQYTKVEDELTDVLDFAGVFSSRTKKLFGFGKKSKQKWFGTVGAAWTSQTCPCCGSVWAKPEKATWEKGTFTVYWEREVSPGARILTIRRNNNAWESAWNDAAEEWKPCTLELGAMLHRYEERLQKAAYAKERSGILRKAAKLFKHRPEQAYDSFSCLRCGETFHADKVGAVNIARKALYQLQKNSESTKKIDWRQDWQNWYRKQIKEKGWWNERTGTWLR